MIPGGFILALETVAGNIDGYTKQITVQVIFFVLYCTGSNVVNHLCEVC